MMESHASAKPYVRRPHASFSPELADVLCRRVARGEPVTRICTDPGMPSSQTVCRWARRRKDFGEALQKAREAAGWVYKRQKREGSRRTRAERLAELGLEIAQAATPETAFLTHVRLTHIRWMARVYAPEASEQT